MTEKIHIGELILQKLKEEQRTVSWFAKKMNYNRTNIYKIFKKPHIDTVQLLQISLILNHDFFSHYSEYVIKNRKM